MKKFLALLLAALTFSVMLAAARRASDSIMEYYDGIYAV